MNDIDAICFMAVMVERDHPPERHAEEGIMIRSSIVVGLGWMALAGCNAGLSASGPMAPGTEPPPGEEPPTSGATSGPVLCELDVQCDDADPCTSDVCLPASSDGEFLTLYCHNDVIAGCGQGQIDCAARCDDGDACTVDTCLASGTGGRRERDECGHESIPGCGGEPTTDPGDAGEAVDPFCATGERGPDVFLPYEPLGAPALPASCAGGIEVQNCRGIVEARSVSPAGSSGTSLVVDFATYTAGDRLRIEGTLASGEVYVLMDTCRVRTWERSDPTDGLTRPPEETVRRFESIPVRAGTVALRFDSSFASTPWYERVLGLCEFEVTDLGECSASYRPAG